MSDIYNSKQIYNYFKSCIPKENKTPESRLKNIDETTNYFTEETNQSDLVSKKHKKVFYSSKLY